MSHFTEVKTKIRNKENLKRALRKLGYQIVEEEAGVQVRGYFGETQTAEFKILTSSHYDVGFRLGSDESYEFVGDWELLPKVSGLEKETFAKLVKRAYAQESILELSERMGYTVETHGDALEEGTVTLTVKQWSQS